MGSSFIVTGIQDYKNIIKNIRLSYFIPTTEEDRCNFLNKFMFRDIELFLKILKSIIGMFFHEHFRWTATL